MAGQDGAHRDGTPAHGHLPVVLTGAGGVGIFALQIANAYGAEVTGVASTAKLDMVRDIGAGHVVDYDRQDFADGEHHYDVIIDTGGNLRLTDLRRALCPKGRLIIVGGETDGRWLGGSDRQIRAQVLSLFVSQKLGTFISSEKAADLVVLGKLIETGDVRPILMHRSGEAQFGAYWFGRFGLAASAVSSAVAGTILATGPKSSAWPMIVGYITATLGVVGAVTAALKLTDMESNNRVAHAGYLAILRSLGAYIVTDFPNKLPSDMEAQLATFAAQIAAVETNL